MSDKEQSERWEGTRDKIVKRISPSDLLLAVNVPSLKISRTYKNNTTS
jgi:hypothetical protein